MYATVRHYTANPGLADAFRARSEEIRKMVLALPGVTAYYLIRTPDGAVAVTVCENSLCAQRSNEIAADWIRRRMAMAVSEPPAIHAGEVLIHSTADARAHALP